MKQLDSKPFNFEHPLYDDFLHSVRKYGDIAVTFNGHIITTLAAEPTSLYLHVRDYDKPTIILSKRIGNPIQYYQELMKFCIEESSEATWNRFFTLIRLTKL